MDYSRVPFSAISAQLRSKEGPESLGGYNALAYNTRGGGNATGVVAPMPIVEMPMGQLYDWQRGDMRSRTRGHRGPDDIGSTGVGAYQFESNTLRDAAQKVFGDDWKNQRFTPENQDRLAEYLYDSVKANPNRLASTWAMFGQNREGDDMQALPMTRAAMSGVTPLEIIGGREGNLKVQDPSQISPEAVQATENINRMQDFKRQMLPLAMGAMMSGDAGSRNYGQNTFREAMEGVEPFKMQNGFLTDEGQYITDQDQSGLLKMTLDQMRKDMTAQRDQGNKNLSFELQLADNYTQNTKKAVDSIDAFKKFETGVNNGMTDMAMVFNFMRILDPESTVKTSEFESVAKARGVPDTVAQLLPKAMAGEILTQPQRDQIKDIGLKFAGDAANVLQGRYDYVKGIGERNNLNVDNVIPGMHGEWIKDIRTKQTAAAERQANAAKPTGQVGTTGSSQEGRRGVQSNAMLDPETGKHFVVENGQVRFVD